MATGMMINDKHFNSWRQKDYLPSAARQAGKTNLMDYFTNPLSLRYFKAPGWKGADSPSSIPSLVRT